MKGKGKKKKAAPRVEEAAPAADEEPKDEEAKDEVEPKVVPSTKDEEEEADAGEPVKAG